MSQDAAKNRQLDHPQIRQTHQTFPISILANDIEIAGNVGSLFRLAEAFGVEKLHLTGSTTIPPKYKIRKAARSADQKITYSYTPSAIEVVTELKSTGTMILSLEVTSKSEDLRAFQLDQHWFRKQQPACLIIGSENAGIAQDLLDLSDHTLHIPMYGENSSMNVASSCAIALYELVKFY